MSRTQARVLRYALLAGVLMPFVFGASFCFAVASDMGQLAGLQGDVGRPARTPAMDAANAVGRVVENALLAAIWFPMGQKHYLSLILNSVFWAVAISASIAVLRWLFRKREIPPGVCVKCGYDLTGNVSGVCPECGEKI